MNQIKKKLCLLSALLIFLTPCAAPVSASEPVLLEDYVVCGTAYTLPTDTAKDGTGEAIIWPAGAAVNTNVPSKRVLKGTTAGESPVELTVNVGMYTPDIIDNLNDETVGAAIKNPALNYCEWETYSLVTASCIFAKESSGNVYLKMRNLPFVSGSTTVYSGAYGAIYTLSGNGKGDGADISGASGDISLEVKIRIPKTVLNNEIEITLLDNGSVNPQNTGDDNSMFVGRMMARNDGYYYYDYYSGGIARPAVKLADYNEQWIALKYMLNTETGALRLYCNGDLCLTVGNGLYFSTSSTKTPGDNVRFLRIRQKEAEVWVDDIVFDADTASTSEPVLYFEDIAAPEYFVSAGAAESGSMLYTAGLEEEDGTASTKKLGLLINSLAPANTSMAGRFEVPITCYEGTAAIYNIYGTDYSVLNEGFSGYAVPDETGKPTWPSNGAVVLESTASENRVLKLEGDATNGSTAAYVAGDASKPVTDTLYETGFKVKPATGTSANDHFYAQLSGSNANYPIINAKFNCNSAGKIATILLNGITYTFSEGEWIHNDWNDVRFKVTEDDINSNVSVDVYFNGSLVISRTSSVDGLANANRQPYRWRFYTASSFTAASLFDDVYIAKFANVASVDTTVNDLTVVRGQSLPVGYVTTTLTDNSTNRLPVIWDAVDTSSTGIKTATGTVYGYKNNDGSAVTVTANVNVISLPYTAAVDGTTLTITRLTDYAPDATIYGAVYDGEGMLLQSVEILGTITADTVWTDDAITLTLDSGKTFRIFVWNSDIQPLAIATP